MKLKKLLNGIKVLNAKTLKNVNIENCSNKTSDDLTNGLYICLKGDNFDGHTLKQQAKEKGAIAFLVEEYEENFDMQQILVKDARVAMSIIAKNFYKKCKLPQMIGITGTNGKTTTTSLVAHILNNNGIKTGLIGTEGIFYADKKINLHMTTPDPLDLFKHLYNMAKLGVKYVVMEVSAHAIFLKKLEALNFKIKAITNITEDHLDFFHTFENYSQTKLNFITHGKDVKIINADDKLCGTLRKNKITFTYSKCYPADCMAVKAEGSYNEYDVLLCGKLNHAKTNLIGAYNAENVLCAMLICKKLGLNDSSILEGIKTFKSVDGRLNVYKKEEMIAIIDFAHTPDALQKVLTTVKQSFSGKVFCIFGCGGNRDSSKRALMGEIASIADYVFISNDNPRYENEKDIANQIASGIKTDNFEIICDREIAVNKAVNMMGENDVLVLAGKGTEDYIEVNGEKMPYSDMSVLTALGFERI